MNRYSFPLPPGDQTFQGIADMVRSICEVPSAAIALVDVDRVWFLSQPGMSSDSALPDASFSVRTIASQDAFVVADAREDALFSRHPLVEGAPHFVSYAGVPMTSPDGYNVGVLSAFDYRPRQFADAQLESLHKLAAMAVGQLEWLQIEQRDALTRAHSHRAFLSAADNVIWQRDWCSLPASLIVFDIDNFRAINSRHGQRAGDAVLRQVARCCMDSESDSDVLARIGGDCFALLRIGEVGSRALATAEEMRASIAALRFDELPGTIVTASFGVAEVNSEIHDAAGWLTEARRWMMAAKLDGGNGSAIDPRSQPRA